jgi:hypothetical protein
MVLADARAGGCMADSERPASLAVEPTGHVSFTSTGPSSDPSSVAWAVCADMSWLTGAEATPIVARYVPGETGGFGGLVTLRRRYDDETAFKTATAIGATEAAAVAMATLAAFGADDLLVVLGRSAAEVPGVVGVTIVDHYGTRLEVGDCGPHLPLVALLPGPGRLSVGLADRECRVLCLPAAAIAVTSKPGCEFEADLERAFARIELAVARCSQR